MILFLFLRASVFGFSFFKDRYRTAADALRFGSGAMLHGAPQKRKQNFVREATKVADFRQKKVTQLLPVQTEAEC
jgi:hypothetical protein